ncbi:hydrolase [Actinoplanes sp. SE50]|uniref:alpha/beta fold hydrolase n=1 Tax=unclassified Actinoplanes TaxID=2626549 RepID=UPI00023EBD0F|nr:MULTISPECIES: alpha/beta fold hydrolase [unclassified Actinoplanes]AEV83456.1 alpha/beta hydrolase fold protein [Actinoplanes sp. SE50/110]ATO81849.1 hydrolase [Actinoplanes sp. SE50]SLL99257.1 hydrolase [Actinoplanes sp. SE50/110]
MNYLDVRGSRIRFHETGDPAAPPVVLLHGIGRSLEDWSLQHPRFDSDYRVISIDMPGFGLSRRVPATTTLPVLADAVWATLDELGETRPVHLMGNSLGGAVSMTMLAGTPDRVTTLTLVNSAGFGKEVTWALRVMALPGLGRTMLRNIDKRTAPRVERTLFRDRALVTPERVEMAIRIAQQPDFAPVYLEVAKALGGLRGVAAPWRTALLASMAGLTTPTMIVWGDRDMILPSHHMAAARAAFPHAQSHMFPETGHMPQIERPDEFAALVRPMLAAVPA